MGLWQLPLLCLAFLGTRNVGQRTNDSIFARSDFLGFHALLRPLRSSSRFACQSFRGPNGRSRGWGGSDGVRGGGSWLEKSIWRGGGDSRVTRKVDFFFFFFCSLPFLVYSCFYFRALSCVLWCITYLTSMLMRKNAFMPRNTCVHKWAFAGTYEHICVLRSTRDEGCAFFLNTTFIEMLRMYYYYYVFFWNTVSCIYHFFFWVNILKIKG